jgi:hypothetical protein
MDWRSEQLLDLWFPGCNDDGLRDVSVGVVQIYPDYRCRFDVRRPSNRLSYGSAQRPREGHSSGDQRKSPTIRDSIIDELDEHLLVSWGAA